MPKIKHLHNRGLIKAMYDMGGSPVKIAKEFGCSVQYVYMAAKPKYEKQVNQTRKDWASRKRTICPITGF